MRERRSSSAAAARGASAFRSVAARLRSGESCCNRRRGALISLASSPTSAAMANLVPPYYALCIVWVRKSSREGTLPLREGRNLRHANFGVGQNVGKTKFRLGVPRPEKSLRSTCCRYRRCEIFRPALKGRVLSNPHQLRPVDDAVQAFDLLAPDRDLLARIVLKQHHALAVQPQEALDVGLG